jgi:hypothetical protein
MCCSRFRPRHSRSGPGASLARPRRATCARGVPQRACSATPAAQAKADPGPSAGAPPSHRRRSNSRAMRPPQKLRRRRRSCAGGSSTACQSSSPGMEPAHDRSRPRSRRIRGHARVSSRRRGGAARQQGERAHRGAPGGAGRARARRDSTRATDRRLSAVDALLQGPCYRSAREGLILPGGSGGRSARRRTARVNTRGQRGVARRRVRALRRARRARGGGWAAGGRRVGGGTRRGGAGHAPLAGMRCDPRP